MPHSYWEQQTTMARAQHERVFEFALGYVAPCGGLLQCNAYDATITHHQGHSGMQLPVHGLDPIFAFGLRSP